eukprot:403334728
MNTQKANTQCVEQLWNVDSVFQLALFSPFIFQCLCHLNFFFKLLTTTLIWAASFQYFSTNGPRDKSTLNRMHPYFMGVLAFFIVYRLKQMSSSSASKEETKSIRLSQKSIGFIVCIMIILNIAIYLNLGYLGEVSYIKGLGINLPVMLLIILCCTQLQGQSLIRCVFENSVTKMLSRVSYSSYLIQLTLLMNINPYINKNFILPYITNGKPLADFIIQDIPQYWYLVGPLYGIFIIIPLAYLSERVIERNIAKLGDYLIKRFCNFRHPIWNYLFFILIPALIFYFYYIQANVKLDVPRAKKPQNTMFRKIKKN